MRFILLALFLLACSWLAVVAGDEDYLVDFHTDPPDARVYLEVSERTGGSGEFLGLASAPVRVPRALLRGRGSARFTFEAPGYLSLQARLTLGDMESGRHPQNGVLSLQPQSPLVGLRRLLGRAWVWVGLGALGALGLVLHLRARSARERDLAERQAALERFQARADRGDPYLMMLLGGYRLVSILGRGASSVVYRGIPDATLDESRDVAVKLLINTADDPERLARFDRESRAYRRLRHPNIAQLYEVGDQHGLRFLVLQRVRGLSLRELYGRESPERLLEWLGEAMAGLQHAHGMNILHRDVKPENIMVELEPAPGPARLMDFGLARLVDSRSLTKEGSALGTPAYMAPEVIRGTGVDGRCDQYSCGIIAYEILAGQRPFSGSDPNTDDGRCDQYSCGIIAYEILAGQRPFSGSDPNTLLYQHLTDDPRELREVRPEVPEEMAGVVMRMISREAAARFESIAQAREALLAALKGSPAS